MKKVENLPKVSIVFSNFNGGKEPLECLASIKKLNYPKNKIQTILIDNGSKDKSPEKIAGKFPEVNLIKLKKDIGLPASLNLGIKKSAGKYIFIANDDIVLEKSSIKNMVHFLEKNTNVGVLGGKVFYKNEPKKLSDSACDFNFYLGEIKKGLAKGEQIKWLQSCSIMVPKIIFQKVGLFDSGFYPLYFDDFDFCLRVKNSGFKIVYLPIVTFWHGVGKTTRQFSNKKVYYWWYKNKIRFYLKNATIVQIITATLFQITAICIKSFKERQNVFSPFARALIVNIQEMNKIRKIRDAKKLS